ncbi:MAG: hypothetical protein PF484_04855 [Bacteroidales bacterium]|jgi:hypothetical protein|nr:hypothetical protein [Bacteroidales bacterium]
MAFSATFLIVAVVVVGIWLFVEVKRLKHKLWAFFLIGLILFTYISFSVSLKGKDVDIKSIDGVIKAGKLYASWLGSLFNNAKSVTAYATKQNWSEYDTNVTNKTPLDPIWDRL